MTHEEQTQRKFNDLNEALDKLTTVMQQMNALLDDARKRIVILEARVETMDKQIKTVGEKAVRASFGFPII